MFPSAFSGEHRPDQEVSWCFFTDMICISGQAVIRHVVNAEDRVRDTDGSDLAFGDCRDSGERSPLIRFKSFAIGRIMKDAMRLWKIIHETAVTSLRK